MMSKELPNPSKALYYDVGNGSKKLGEDNFGRVFEQLPSKEEFLEYKRTSSDFLLKLLSSVDASFVFSERDFVSFNENPLEFRKKVMPDSVGALNLKGAVELQALLNDLYGNYSVAMAIISYLDDLNRQNIAKNTELLQKYALACVKLKDFGSLAELQAFSIGEMPKKKIEPEENDESYIPLPTIETNTEEE